MKLKNKILEKEMFKIPSVYMPYIYADHTLLDPVPQKPQLLRNTVRTLKYSVLYLCTHKDNFVAKALCTISHGMFPKH